MALAWYLSVSWWHAEAFLLPRFAFLQQACQSTFLCPWGQHFIAAKIYACAFTCAHSFTVLGVPRFLLNFGVFQCFLPPSLLPSLPLNFLLLLSFFIITIIIVFYIFVILVSVSILVSVLVLVSVSLLVLVSVLVLVWVTLWVSLLLQTVHNLSIDIYSLWQFPLKQCRSNFFLFKGHPQGYCVTLILPSLLVSNYAYSQIAVANG